MSRAKKSTGVRGVMSIPIVQVPVFPDTEAPGASAAAVVLSSSLDCATAGLRLRLLDQAGRALYLDMTRARGTGRSSYVYAGNRVAIDTCCWRAGRSTRPLICGAVDRRGGLGFPSGRSRL